MAYRKKPIVDPVKNNEDEVQKLKNTLTGDSAAVKTAATKFFGTTVKNPAGEIGQNGTPIDSDWMEMKRETDGLDKQFREDYMNNFENVDVRVMQVGPDGRLTDVSDRVKPQDIRPDQIADTRFEGRGIPRGRDGRIDREAALDLLTQILGNSDRLYRGDKDTSFRALKAMEAALASSDKILEHWKK